MTKRERALKLVNEICETVPPELLAAVGGDKCLAAIIACKDFFSDKEDISKFEVERVRDTIESLFRNGSSLYYIARYVDMDEKAVVCSLHERNIPVDIANKRINSFIMHKALSSDFPEELTDTRNRILKTASDLGCPAVDVYNPLPLPITADEAALMRQMYTEGFPYYDIAFHAGRPLDAIAEALNLNLDYTDMRVLYYWLRGRSIPFIAMCLDIDEEAIRALLYRMGYITPKCDYGYNIGKINEVISYVRDGNEISSDIPTLLIVDVRNSGRVPESNYLYTITANLNANEEVQLSRLVHIGVPYEQLSICLGCSVKDIISIINARKL